MNDEEEVQFRKVWRVQSSRISALLGSLGAASTSLATRDINRRDLALLLTQVLERRDLEFLA